MTAEVVTLMHTNPYYCWLFNTCVLYSCHHGRGLTTQVLEKSSNADLRYIRLFQHSLQPDMRPMMTWRLAFVMYFLFSLYAGDYPACQCLCSIHLQKKKKLHWSHTWHWLPTNWLRVAILRVSGDLALSTVHAIHGICHRDLIANNYLESFQHVL